MYDEIERREEALEDLAKQRKLRPSQTKYFVVEEEGAKTLRYGKDYETIDKLSFLTLCGLALVARPLGGIKNKPRNSPHISEGSAGLVVVSLGLSRPINF